MVSLLRLTRVLIVPSADFYEIYASPACDFTDMIQCNYGDVRVDALSHDCANVIAGIYFEAKSKRCWNSSPDSIYYAMQETKGLPPFIFTDVRLRRSNQLDA